MLYAASAGPMKEKLTPSPTSVASDTNHKLSQRSSSQANNDVQNDDDFDDDWDFGVGKLVIDLDADAERSKPNSSINSTGNMSSPLKVGTFPNSKATPTPSSVEHQAIVDKGLKMKITKRRNGSGKADSKQELIKEAKLQNINNSDSPITGKPSLANDKEKVGKGRGIGKKDRLGKERSKVGSQECVPNGNMVSNPGSSMNNSSASNSSISPNSQSSPPGNNLISSAQISNVSVELDRLTMPYSTPTKNTKSDKPDPYAFDAKEEDDIELPMKKCKVEKMEPQTQDAGTEMVSTGTTIDPDCLGPCEPGTNITIDGIVWHETENGVLVLNVSWRGRTYVGTLMDTTKHTWAPPRWSSESPTSDLESRTPKGRGKRRAAMVTPGADSVYCERRLRGGKGRRNNSTNNFVQPASPAKDVTTGTKRRGRQAENEPSELETRAAKRSRSSSNSRSTPTRTESPQLIECPEPNCNKKYRHINGLRYHQSHAHQNNENQEETMEDSKEDGKFEDAQEDNKNDKELSTDNDVKNTDKQNDSDKNKNDVDIKKSENIKKEKSESPMDVDNDTEPSTSSKKSKGPVEQAAPSATKVDKNGNSQVFQISGSALSCLGNVAVVKPQPGTAVQVNSAVVRPNTNNQIAVGATISAVPVTVTTGPVLIDDKSKKIKVEKNDKNKVKTTTTRPIMPAPPQMAVTHTSLASVPTHVQLTTAATTSQLKPIQPKPTILGETASVNPALVNLKQEKKKNKKKNLQEKKPDGSSPPSSVHLNATATATTGVAKESGELSIKIENTSVIKNSAVVNHNSVPNRVMPGNIQGQKAHSELPKINLSPGKEKSEGALSPAVSEQSHKMSRPPSNLSINSPIENGDANSPAYSDISDANDTAPTLENETQPPSKAIEVDTNVKSAQNSTSTSSRPTPSAASSNGPPHGFMYPPGYYGQPPYLVPAVPQPSQQSPNQEQAPKRDSKPVENKEAAPIPQPQMSVKIPASDTVEIKEVKNEEVSKERLVAQQQQQRAQQEYQKMMNAHYASYYAQLGYDPNVIMAMSNDPNYRQQYEKMMADHQRRQAEQQRAGGDDKISPRPRNEQALKASDLSPTASQSQGVIKSPHNHSSSPSTPGSARPVDKSVPSQSKPPALISDKDKQPEMAQKGLENKRVDQSLREKQNENHQILKENIELKQQMENRQKNEGYDPKLLYERQREDYQKYMMMQKLEQQRYEERKFLEQQHLQARGGELRPPGHRPGSNPPPQVDKTPTGRPSPGPRDSREIAKASPLQRERSQSRESAEGRHRTDMRSPHDRLRNESPHTKNISPRSTPTSKSKTEPTMGGPIGHMSHPNSSVPGAYAQYYPHAAYLQQSPHSHYPGQGVPLDHPMFRGMNPAQLAGYPHGLMMANPGGGHIPVSVADQPGNAAEMLQQHAAHYYGNSAAYMVSQQHAAAAAAAAGLRPPYGPR